MPVVPAGARIASCWLAQNRGGCRRITHPGETGSMTLSRRQMLFASGAALLGATAPRRLFAANQATKRVLFFTKSSGFQHSCITRKGDQLSVAEKILTDAGKQHG